MSDPSPSPDRWGKRFRRDGWTVSALCVQRQTSLPDVAHCGARVARAAARRAGRACFLPAEHSAHLHLIRVGVLEALCQVYAQQSGAFHRVWLVGLVFAQHFHLHRPRPSGTQQLPEARSWPGTALALPKLRDSNTAESSPRPQRHRLGLRGREAETDMPSSLCPASSMSE
jgi:hypothetical protein